MLDKIASFQNMQSYKKFHSFLISIPLHITILAIILNDWRLGSFSFSDPLVILGTLMLIGGLRKISPKQALLLLGITLTVVLNFFIASATWTNYASGTNILYIPKVVLYATFTVLIYNYVLRRQLHSMLTKVLAGWAVAVSLLGFYISAVIAFNINLPYEFFWTFTRQDVTSYIYMGESGIVRARSIFSEPQHFGLFLNLSLLVLLFNNIRAKVKKVPIILLSIASLLTLSFSTIPVTLLILGLAFIKKYGFKFFVRPEFIGFIVAAILISSFLWEYINTTIVQRLQNISSGNDGSATLRLVDSWQYTSVDNILLGSGIGSTPYIQNNYAYILSDFGIITLMLMVYLTIIIFKRNAIFGIFFALFSFQIGGYLSAFYWLLILLLFIFSTKNTNKEVQYA